jgi:NAD(P)-dependent dehydrogenase (short-subunit alcohol dehydrogenase family)
MPSPIPPTPQDTQLTGKTIIVTGGNTGLGLEASRQFLRLGAARVILACRSVTKGHQAAADLRADPDVKRSNPTAVIDVFELDLADYQSGLHFANKIKQDVKGLDILLCNGGVHNSSFSRSKNGHEMNMQGESTHGWCHCPFLGIR